MRQNISKTVLKLINNSRQFLRWRCLNIWSLSTYIFTILFLRILLCFSSLIEINLPSTQENVWLQHKVFHLDVRQKYFAACHIFNSILRWCFEIWSTRIFRVWYTTSIEETVQILFCYAFNSDPICVAKLAKVWLHKLCLRQKNLFLGNICFLLGIATFVEEIALFPLILRKNQSSLQKRRSLRNWE